MTAQQLSRTVIGPTLTLLGADYQHPTAHLLLLMIALQESGLTTRRQQPSGPARSWWQIEPATAADVIERCPFVAAGLTDIGWPHEMMYQERYAHWLEASELGACMIARGLLYLDPEPLALQASRDSMWDYYIRTWRPGHPRPETWATHHAMAYQSL